MIGAKEIERRFTFKAPDELRRLKHEEVGDSCKSLAHQLDALLPDGREKMLAMTALEEVRMRANQAIATCVEDESEPTTLADRGDKPGQVEAVDTTDENPS